MKVMTQETKTKLHDVHVELAKDPARKTFLQSIARDPANKEKRAAAMKLKWEDPVWKAATLAKMKASREAKAAEEAQAEADRTTPAEKAAAEANEAPVVVLTTAQVEANAKAASEAPVVPDIVISVTKAEGVVVKKKRVVTDEQKAKYTANRKAKRAAAKS